MKRIEVTVKNRYLEAIVEALDALDIEEITAIDVDFSSDNKRPRNRDRRVPIRNSQDKIEIIVEDDEVAQTVQAIEQAILAKQDDDSPAREKNMCEIFILPVEQYLDI
jgi:nitrogen regulatory protein PII